MISRELSPSLELPFTFGSRISEESRNLALFERPDLSPRRDADDLEAAAKSCLKSMSRRCRRGEATPTPMAMRIKPAGDDVDDAATAADIEDAWA